MSSLSCEGRRLVTAPFVCSGWCAGAGGRGVRVRGFRPRNTRRVLCWADLCYPHGCSWAGTRTRTPGSAWAEYSTASDVATDRLCAELARGYAACRSDARRAPGIGSRRRVHGRPARCARIPQGDYVSLGVTLPPRTNDHSCHATIAMREAAVPLRRRLSAPPKVGFNLIKHGGHVLARPRLVSGFIQPPSDDERIIVVLVPRIGFGANPDGVPGRHENAPKLALAVPGPPCPPVIQTHRAQATAAPAFRLEAGSCFCLVAAALACPK